MKKLLLVAVVLSLFVANAYALEMQVFGHYEQNGVYVVNNSLGDDDDKVGPNQDRAFFDQTLRIWTRLLVDPRTTITVRTTVMDGRLLGTGTNAVTAGNGDVVLDRAWISYKLMDGLTADLGRMTGNNYTVGWASGLYDGTYRESGGRDQFKATYIVNDEVSVYGVYVKNWESSTQAPGNPQAFGEQTNGSDAYAGIFGAKMKFDDIFVNPYISYFWDGSVYTTNPTTGNLRHLDPSAIYSLYVEGGMAPALGLNAILALGYTMGSGSGDAYAKDYSAYGAYLDVSYIQEQFTVGAFVAYSSYDKKDGWFEFGGDFDKTIVIDDYLGDEWGVPANTMLQIYAAFDLIERLDLALSGSYYMSNVDSKDATPTLGRLRGQANGIGEDTNAYEIDATLSYAFNPNTTFSIGAGYAQINDVYIPAADETYSPDAIIKAFWNVYTAF